MRDFIVFLQEDENIATDFGLFGKKYLDLAIYIQVFLNPDTHSLLIRYHTPSYSTTRRRMH